MLMLHMICSSCNQSFVATISIMKPHVNLDVFSVEFFLLII